jgi:hypothetical protein
MLNWRRSPAEASIERNARLLMATSDPCCNVIFPGCTTKAHGNLRNPPDRLTMSVAKSENWRSAEFSVAFIVAELGNYSDFIRTVISFQTMPRHIRYLRRCADSCTVKNSRETSSHRERSKINMSAQGVAGLPHPLRSRRLAPKKEHGSIIDRTKI